MNKDVHSHTPQLSVIDSRGLPVRQVAYWRREINQLIPETRVTVRQHDAAGRQVAQRDPRFLAPASRPNVHSVYSVSAITLLTDSVDAGWRLVLPNEAGQISEHRDSRGSQWRSEYDEQQRLIAIHEHMRGSNLRTVERLTYAGNRAEFAERNQCGELIRHDDRAGVTWFKQTALSGALILQLRRFLPDQSDVHSDWPIVEAERDDLLQPGPGYTTESRSGPGGEVLEQTDAGGHRQHFGVDRAGQLQRIDLTLKSRTTQPLLKAAHYDAEGRWLAQITGNNVTSNAAYETSTGRLKRLTATAPEGVRLQDLDYEYDPVGNIVRLLDRTQPVTYLANQCVVAENTYAYDSLYQLMCATGRETVQAGQHPGLPELVIPAPIDPGRLLNYTEYYHYDEGGNRTELRHVSDQHPFRQRMRIDPHSNRTLPWNAGDDEPDFQHDFDANGNLQRLVPGAQPMAWDGLNQLHSVTTVHRSTAADDSEGYRYNAAGERVVKFSHQQAHGVTHQRVVHYLPGLEVRTTDDDEELQVICVPLGRGSVRCLHWVKGKPAGIEADQLRYSVDDQVGSCSLELDKHAAVISHEGYYPYGGTAWWAARSRVDADYKTVRYSGKEQDACGFYYYGARYYAPWLGRWVSPDPAEDIDGLNLYKMVGNNPIVYTDPSGQKKSKINKVIHLIWIGEAPEKLESQIANINNTVKRASGYKVKLYLDTTNKESFASTLKQLKVHDITFLRESKLFSDFQKTEVATIYNDFRSGSPKNLAFAADVLRPYIVHKLGGLYSDVDDVYVKENTEEQKKLGNTSLRADPDELITGDPVFVPWQGIGCLPLINNSSFAAHAGNSILTDIMDEMMLRYKEIVESGKYSDSNGHIGDGILEKEPEDRIRIMTKIVGPHVFTDVLSRHDSELKPILEQRWKMHVNGEHQKDFMKKIRTKMPLGQFLSFGTLHSWK